MKDAERIAELEAALRRSELLVEQLQAQLNLGRKKVQAAPGVPEGWRLVPVEPTPKMLVAYMEADGAIKRWKAMIAAAPAQPAAHDELLALAASTGQEVEK